MMITEIWYCKLEQEELLVKRDGIKEELITFNIINEGDRNRCDGRRIIGNISTTTMMIIYMCGTEKVMEREKVTHNYCLFLKDLIKS